MYVALDFYIAVTFCVEQLLSYKTPSLQIQSVDFMAEVVLGEEFQGTIKGIVKKMSKKK
jgi:hypothetical protein